ncbi:MAG: 50S ribosomal protein L4 [Ruminococcaceae bacterium]|nr:50S ribosomal protein L4 [Oscillospiraceae bacterium]
MAKVNVYNMEGKVVEELELNPAIFDVEVNVHCMHAAVVNQLANKRQGTHSTLTKSEVSGGGKKPYKQKGTGHARQGSTRSAQWIHGGIVFGPKPRDYSYTLPKQVKRLALKSSLTSKVIDSNFIVLDTLAFDSIKTKNMVKVLGNLNVEDSALVVLPEKDLNVVKSASNIAGISTAYVNTINVYDILRHTKLIVTKEALEKISEVYA